MIPTRTLLSTTCLVFSIVAVAALGRAPSATLTYVNGSADTGQQLTLRRDGERLVVVDDRSHAIVASASAARTQRVIVQGADGGDDTLTLDLTASFSLPGGIDYDGGAGGWDTLVVTGGAIQNETVTQLTPHDGVFDLDGLVLRYTNLEPITDTVPAALLTINGTAGADTVTVSDGPGVGEATISSPTFESITFANKTNLVFDGAGGGDSFTLNNPTPPAGLASFIIQNVATVDQTAAVSYPALGVSATGNVILNAEGNNVSNLEIATVNGSIDYVAADDVRIGGVSAELAGVRVTNSGSITLQTGATITLRDNDAADIIRAGDAGGDVTIQAVGVNANLQVEADRVAIVAPAGSVTVVAGGDILLGLDGDEFDNDVRASGAVALTARDIHISGGANVASDDFGNGTGGTASATASRDFLLSTITGTGATFGASGTAGANTTITATTGSVNLEAVSAAALHSASGAVSVTTRRLIIAPASGITTTGAVVIASAGVALDIGSLTDVGAALELSDAEADRIITTSLVVQSAAGFNLTVTQAITRANALTLQSDATFSATGSGSLSAPTLTFQDVGSSARTWTIGASTVTIGPGAAIPFSGVTTLNANGGSGSDIFNVMPSATTTIAIDGNGPMPPASPGDALNVNLSGTTSPSVSYTSSDTGLAGGYAFGNRAPVTFTEVETLDPATPTLTTAASANVVLGGAVRDTATLANGLSPTGTITFRLYGPDDATCAGAPVFTSAPVAVSGNGSYDSADFTPTLAGTYRWIASYSGDANNDAVAGICNAPNESVTVAPPAADLAVVKTAATMVVAGNDLTYTITVVNNGPQTASNATLTDILPTGTSFISATPSQGSCSGTTTVTCNLGTLLNGASATVTLVVAVTATSGIVSNTASVSSDAGDPTPANNSSTADTTVDGAPTITDIANQTIVEDTSTTALGFTIGDVGTPAPSLVVSGSSSDTVMIPNANIVFGGTGASRTVTVTPLANQNGGPVTITVTVSDGGLSASETFTLTVTAVNDPPTITPIANQTIDANSATSPLPFTIGDVETAATSLAVSGSSSNPTLVPTANIVFNGSGASRTVTVTPAAGASGQTTITVTVSDGVVGANSPFVVTVNAPAPEPPAPPAPAPPPSGNSPPTIGGLASTTIEENGSATLTLTLNDDATPAANLIVGVSSSNTALVPTSALVLNGTGVVRTLTVSPVLDNAGQSTITVTLSDGTLTTTATAVLTVAAATAPPPPPAPLVGSVLGAEVALSWTAPAASPNPSFYVLEGGTAPGLSTLPVVNTVTRRTSWTLSLPPGLYFFRARSGNRAGISSVSNEVSLLVTSPLNVPGSPVGVQVTVAGTHVTLTWQEPATGGPVGTWQIELSQPGAPSDMRTFLVPGAVRSVAADLPRGDYSVRIRGVNDAGPGPASTETRFSVDEPGGGGCDAPEPPVLLPATIVGRTVTLSWRDPRRGGPVHYRLLVGSVPGGSDLLVHDVGAVTSFVGQANPGTYYVSVVATNTCGPGVASNSVAVVITNTGPPAPPANVRGLAAGGGVTIAWDAVPGAISYLIEAGTLPGVTNAAVLPLVETMATLSGVPSGVYYVRVRAIGAGGASGPSAEVVVIVP